MNDAELEIYSAILTVKKLLPGSVESVHDVEEIRSCIEGLTEQLLKTVGRRIVRESRKNGQTSTS